MSLDENNLDNSPDSSGDGAQHAANPGAMTPEQVSKILAAVGSRHASPEAVARHIAAGAPVSADGKINLVHYVAWLVREVSHGEE